MGTSDDTKGAPMSRMKVTEAGIDWHRLTDDEVETVGARIVDAATAGCPGYYLTGWRQTNEVRCSGHFTDGAGREVCPRLALEALEVEASNGTFSDVLAKPRRIA
jgi:hypothetical protein